MKNDDLLFLSKDIALQIDKTTDCYQVVLHDFGNFECKVLAKFDDQYSAEFLVESLEFANAQKWLRARQ